jgi:multiple sugar transport system permease protein
VATHQRGRRAQLREAFAGYGLLLPSLVGIVGFLVLPSLIVVWLSFHKWDLIGAPKNVGWANWHTAFTTPGLGNSLWVTILLVILVIPLQTALGILLAVLLTRKLRGSGLLRTIFVIPWVCAPLALGVVWSVIFQPTGGALNQILGTRVAWLTEPALALPAVAAVAIWSQAGYVALFFMAGLAAIPGDVVEAARVDGAGSARIFWNIKMPLLRPTLFFVLVTTIISTFQITDSIFALTQGGPGTSTDVIAYRIYRLAFKNFDMGKAAVTSLVLFAVLVIVTVAQQRYFRRRITYDLT